MAAQALPASIVTEPSLQSGSPPKPAKVEPASGVAVSVTTVPVAKAAEQVAPQSIPAGLLVTVPVPAPSLLTVRVNCCVNVAVQVVFAISVTCPSEQSGSPPKPAKTDPLAGVAVCSLMWG